MKNRKLNVFALMINLTVFILTAYSVAHNFRTDIIRNVETVNDSELTNFTGFQSFRYFTTLSNVFSAIAAAIMVVFNVKNVINDGYEFPKWAIVLKYVATCSVAVTFITVAGFLSPLIAFYGKSYFTLFKGNSFFVHFLNPLLAIFCFVFLEREYRLNIRHALLGALPAMAYSVVYTLTVAILKIWPDFYGFTFNGTTWALPIVILCMYGVAFCLALLINIARNRILRKYN